MARLAALACFNGLPIDPERLALLTRGMLFGAPAHVDCASTPHCGVACITANSTGARNPTASPLRHRQQQRVWLYTADARLDNGAELLAALGAASGPRPREPDDSRVILLAYLKWGVDCVRHLTGDFAFAIWDDANRRLFCARDALGVKPLYYATASDMCCVASQARQILGQPGMVFSLNESAVAEYLSGYCTARQASFFEGLSALPGGHVLLASRHGLRVSRYWYPEHLPTIRYRDRRAYAEHFREIFQAAVTSRIRGEDRVAVCVSGGLDSGSVAAVAQQSRETTQLHGFTRVSDALPDCDERRYSRHLSQALGLVIEPVSYERFWLLDDDHAFTPRVDSPFLAFASHERYVHARCRKLGIRVLLTGHGGDSVVAGSTLAYLDQLLSGHLGVFRDIRQHARRNGQSTRALVDRHLLRPLISGSLKAWVRAHLPWRDPAIPSWLDKGFARRVDLSRRARTDGRAPRVRGRGRQHRIAKVRDLGSVARAVCYLDRSAFEYGLEYRHPFLDRRLVDYTLSLPDNQLFAAGQTKLVLRAALQGTLPDAIRARQGKTYPDAYVDHSLRDVSADKIAAMFSDPMCAARGFVDHSRLQTTWRRFLLGDPSVPGYTLWFPITLEAWLRSSSLDSGCGDISRARDLG